MNEKSFFDCLNPYLEKMSRYYSYRFRVEKEELFSEGALTLIITFRNYREKKNDKELEKIAKKVINRAMYSVVRKELNEREFIVLTSDGEEI